MGSISHQNHQMSDEVARVARLLLESGEEARNRQDRIDRIARPDMEERRIIAEARRASMAGRIDENIEERMREMSSRRFQRITGVLEEAADYDSTFRLQPWRLEQGEPEPADPTFWWARTDWSHPDHFTAALRDDGLHFYGGVTTHDGDLHNHHIGAVALFELHKERIPQSSLHLWRSTPYIELFGQLLGLTGNDDIATGDLWSKCWLHLDQQIYQNAFGMDGPVPVVLGQAHDFKTLIFEENEDRLVRVPLPGFLWMPPVTFRDINPAYSVWSRLEITFHIQTEGAGTLVWLDPEVLLRTFQWQLTAL